MPIIDPQTYSRNIAALRARQPEVASAIDAATGPEARLVAGRDGSATFLISNESGETWLGGSSMPSVSAEEVFRGFAGGHENVFVPGIMSGREVLHLAGRLRRHAAIFVVESSAYHLQLALRLHDFSGFVDRGQIVILLESDFETQLLALFQRFPGYVLPSRMLTIPHRSPLAHAELQRRLERAGVQLARQQADLLANLRDRLASQAMRRDGHSERLDANGAKTIHRVAVLSIDASDFTHDDARRLTAALGDLGWAHGCCIPDRPQQCHAVARLLCTDELQADRVILVNSPPRSLGPLAPKDMPIISWYFASARIPATMDPTLNPADSFVVTSKAQQAQLVSAGVPEGRVYYAGITPAPLAPGEPPAEQSPGAPGVGANAPVLEPLKIANDSLGIDESASTGPRSATISEKRRPGRGKPAFDVLVAGDAPDDRPESAGITMGTHATLWRECAKLAAEHMTRSKIAQAAELLALAEQHGRAKLSDAKIRGEMLLKIEERVLPAAFARQLACQLASRVKVAFAGANWPNGQESPSRSATADTAVAHAEFPLAGVPGFAKRARWIVLPFFSTAAIQTAVDVLAAGGCVALRAGRTPLAEAHPELRELAKFIPTFTNPKQAVEIVGKERWWSVDDIRCTLESLSLGAVLMRVIEAAKGRRVPVTLTPFGG